MVQKLITRVKSHTTSQNTQGQVTLALTKECIEHGFEHNDFTPLVALVSLSQPAQGRAVRAIIGKVVNGYRLAKSDKADFGMKFTKVKDANQGVNDTQMRKLSDLIEEKKSIQSEAVKAFIKGEVVSKKFEAKDVEKHLESAAKWVKDHADVEVAEKIKDLERMLAAYNQVLSSKGAINH